MSKFLNKVAATSVASVLALGVCVATPAFAEEEAAAESPFTMAANVGLYSDYRFRGVSLNEENIAVQGGFDFGYAVNDAVNLYLGTWASSLAPSTSPFGSAEVDLYGGATVALGAATLKLGAIGYMYPTGQPSLTNYYEIQAEVSGALGPLNLAVGTFLAPKQVNYGSKFGKYFYTSASAAIPGTPLTASAGIGLEDNAFFNDKIDWNIGLAASYEQFTLKLQYIDSDQTIPYGAKGKNAAGGTVVVSLVAAF